MGVDFFTGVVGPSFFTILIPHNDPLFVARERNPLIYQRVIRTGRETAVVASASLDKLLVLGEGVEGEMEKVDVLVAGVPEDPIDPILAREPGRRLGRERHILSPKLAHRMDIQLPNEIPREESDVIHECRAHKVRFDPFLILRIHRDKSVLNVVARVPELDGHSWGCLMIQHNICIKFDTQISSTIHTTMSGTRYPLNLAEMCWRLGLRKPELIEAMHTEHQAQVETIRVLTEQLEALKDDSEVSATDASDKSTQTPLSETIPDS